jgi:hypothetical protein
MLSCINNYNHPKLNFGAIKTPKKTVVDIAHNVAEAREIQVSAHGSLDEDAINSSLVVIKWLKKLGKKVSFCYNPEDTKGLFINFWEKLKLKKAGNKPSDLTFNLDYNAKERIPNGHNDLILGQKPEKRIGLDHHDILPSTIESDMFIDSKAHSTCGMVYRLLKEGMGVKLSQRDLQHLYCGVLSDYSKSKLIAIDTSSKVPSVIKRPLLDEHPLSKEVLEKIEGALSQRRKDKVHKHLNVLSKLNKEDKSFRKDIYSQINISQNGKLAYLVIAPDEAKMGMDNPKTSTILGDLRSRVLANDPNDPYLSDVQKEKLKDVKGAIAFYRVAPNSEVYQMSITTKDDYASQLIRHIKKNIDPDLAAGGHPDRAGGRVFSLDPKKINGFVSSFIQAAETLG